MIPGYRYRSEDFIRMEVLSSNEGQSWKFEGAYAGTPTDPSSSAANPDVKQLKFRAPVKARYFKFNITRSTNASYYSSVAEIYGIK
jgi:hypothetical protein